MKDSNRFAHLVVFVKETIYLLIFSSSVWKYSVKRYLGLLKIILGSQLSLLVRVQNSLICSLQIIYFCLVNIRSLMLVWWNTYWMIFVVSRVKELTGVNLGYGSPPNTPSYLRNTICSEFQIPSTSNLGMYLGVLFHADLLRTSNI